MTTYEGSEPHEAVDPHESNLEGEHLDDAPERAAEPQRALAPDTPESKDASSFADSVVKVVSEAAYAVVGLAADASERAKEFYNERRERAVSEGDESSLSYAAFVTVPDRVAKFGEDVAETIQSLAEKGRERLHRAQQELDDDLASSGAHPDSSHPDTDDPDDSGPRISNGAG